MIDNPTAKKKQAKLVWRLIVWNISPEYAGLMARLKMIPAKDKPTTFWREYPGGARAQVLAARDLLAGTGLHGIAKLVPAPKPEQHQVKRRFNKSPKITLASRDGFGGALNARPIPGSYRLRARRR